MLSEVSFLAFWHSITEEHAFDVVNRAKGITDHFDFQLPNEFKDFTTGSWKIQHLDNNFTAFSKNPLNITGKTPDVYVADEVTKFDPPHLYERLKREATAAMHSGKFFKNSTTLHSNSFEEEVKETPVIGISYDQHLGTFDIPTMEQWIKARNEYVAKHSKEPESLKTKDK